MGTAQQPGISQEQRARAITFAQGMRLKHLFLLAWEGGKTARGATLDGTEIGWMQHGRVVGVGGEELGSYERLEEFGGPSGESQLAAIMTDCEVLIDPDGQQITSVPLQGNTAAAPADAPKTPEM